MECAGQVWYSCLVTSEKGPLGKREASQIKATPRLSIPRLRCACDTRYIFEGHSIAYMARGTNSASCLFAREKNGTAREGLLFAELAVVQLGSQAGFRNDMWVARYLRNCYLLLCTLDRMYCFFLYITVKHQQLLSGSFSTKIYQVVKSVYGIFEQDRKSVV